VIVILSSPLSKVMPITLSTSKRSGITPLLINIFILHTPDLRAVFLAIEGASEQPINKAVINKKKAISLLIISRLKVKLNSLS
jgi:hypothetical protein